MSGVARGEQPFLQQAKESSEIIKWGEQTYGSCPHQEFESSGKRCLVLLPDVGSGLGLRMILIYTQAIGEWSFTAMYKTNTNTVKIDQDGDTLRFTSKAGKPLLSLSIANLCGGFDPKEQ